MQEEEEQITKEGAATEDVSAIQWRGGEAVPEGPREPVPGRGGQATPLPV